ncbi:tyrosine-type recombinase/integrase [Streptomonospora wellingtoniae]|uniref:Tyrosine-type recombinase/integrase n=1 Tax=Streptomonospora wellingtoniae TaxID=3075544 RepID=A0ABU2KXS7_9ACTN|nr:tyrosine-type recombinase/integrase [Streptomonospora sp. DSM 45055]MDT0303982.1 tyrosine-type recombinase/integrase [Streptomonospora sp. DSM 45055]
MSDEKKKRAAHGDDSIYWVESKNRYVGAISMGFTPAGKRRRYTRMGRTKTEVRTKLRELRQELETGVRAPTNYTVGDAVEDFLKRGLKKRSANTVAKCRHLADKHIYPALGKAKLKDLTADDVDDWLEDKADELATRTLRELHAVLRRAIAFAQRRDKVLRNVAELVTTPDGKEGRPSKALTLAQATAVLAAARGTQLHAYVVLSLLIGVRTEEARALEWRHVHLEPPAGAPPHVEVWRSVREGGDTKTRKSRRTLALPPQVVTALKEHKARQDDQRAAAGAHWQEHDLVFCSHVGTELDAANVRRGFRAIVKRAKIGGTWTPRELRHSFVSLMSEKGVPLEAIARLVGHSTTSTTELVYRKELRPVITEGAEAMGELFNQGQNDPD